jgi:hypothetical protein
MILLKFKTCSCPNYLMSQLVFAVTPAYLFQVDFWLLPPVGYRHPELCILRDQISVFQTFTSEFVCNTLPGLLWLESPHLHLSVKLPLPYKDLPDSRSLELCYPHRALGSLKYHAQLILL